MGVFLFGSLREAWDAMRDRKVEEGEKEGKKRKKDSLSWVEEKKRERHALIGNDVVGLS